MNPVYFLNKSKGQSFSFDFLIACGAFLFFMAIIVAQIGQNSKEMSEAKEKNDLIEEAYTISEIFFSEGYPSNWEESNVYILGLESEGRLNYQKLEKFKSMDYQKSLILLGVKNDYNITVFDNQSAIYTIGKSTSENTSSIVRVDRIGILNGTLVSIQILVFN